MKRPGSPLDRTRLRSEPVRQRASKVALDLEGRPLGPGASVAALFLDKFVPEGTDWAHFDTFAWRPTAKPGRPKGGDALGMRATWRMLQQRYG